MKGVITAVSGSAGTIGVGGGQRYFFSAESLRAGYAPVLKDVVEFSLVESTVSDVHLYYRASALGAQAQTTDVDLRVRCPHCHEAIMPRARVIDGQVRRTECPECGAVLEIMDPRAESIRRWPFVVMGLAVAVAMVVSIYFAMQ